MTTVLDTTKKTVTSDTPKEAPRARLPRPKPVSVNGVVIPRDEIGRETQHHPARQPIDAWLAAARALVVRELLLQEARRVGIAAAPLADDEGRRETDEDAQIRELLEREVVTPEADEAACRRIYEQKQRSFRSADLYAVRHILIAAPPADAVARREARGTAERLIERLTGDPDAFAEMAELYSACSSKQHGGELGQITRGQTVAEFEAALADAPVGSIAAEPVETRFGFHVIVVDQRIDGVQLPFEVVRDRIASWLVERSRETAIRQYIGMLAGRATITGIEFDASASPLVQ